MTKLQRIRSFCWGFLLIVLTVIMQFDAELGFVIAAIGLCLMLLWMGIKYLFFYVFMARNMVGGKAMLYTGLILLDFGVFLTTMTASPRIFLMMYLFGSHAVSGGIDIMRGLEAKKMESPVWKLSTSKGVVNIVMAVLCLVFLRSDRVLEVIYSLGLLYSAGVHIASAFRKTSIAYIP